MSGRGRYTTYVPVASVKYNLLGRLFRGNATAESPFAKHMESGDNEQARLETVARARQFLQPDLQQGDPNYLPNGVRLDFSGDPEGITPPDIAHVKWERPGDASNGYFPDLRSPGPGVSDPKARDTDPEITIEQIKGPGYIPGQPGVSTATSPTSKIAGIHATNELGKALPQGKSSEGEPSGF